MNGVAFSEVFRFHEDLQVWQVDKSESSCKKNAMHVQSHSPVVFSSVGQIFDGEPKKPHTCIVDLLHKM